jgi:hypothetical protein
MSRSQSLFPNRIRRMIHQNCFNMNATELTQKINSSRTARGLHVSYTMPTIRTAVANITRNNGQVASALRSRSPQ